MQPRKRKPLSPKSKATSKDTACGRACEGRVCCTGVAIPLHSEPPLPVSRLAGNIEPRRGLAVGVFFPGEAACAGTDAWELSGQGAASRLDPERWLLGWETRSQHPEVVESAAEPGELGSGHRQAKRVEGPREGAVSSRRARPKQEALGAQVPHRLCALHGACLPGPPPASLHPPSSPQDEAGRKCERRGPGCL